MKALIRFADSLSSRHLIVFTIGAVLFADKSLAQVDPGTVNARLQSKIQDNINNPWPGISDTNNAAGIFSYALACLHLNQNVSQANQLLFNFYTNNPIPPKGGGRDDWNGYFWQHIVWRLFHDPHAGSRLTAQTRERIEDNMWVWLDTRSKISEAEQSEWLIYDSENHDAMTKGSHLMCLLALKNSPRYGPAAVLGDGGTVAEHLDAWTEFYMRYFRARAQEGINVEIACQQYARYTVGAYYNIMDFAESAGLRALAKTFIDLYWADTASDWLHSGVRGGGQTRCYREGSYIRTGTSYAFHGPLWAQGWHENEASIRTYQMIMAVSPYRIPDIITACAADPARPNFLYTSRRFGRGGAWNSNSDYTVVFDNGDSSIRRETFVTSDYTMGGFTLDMNKDYIALIDQNRVMGVMFAFGPNERIMVFGKGGSDITKSFADINGVTRENCMVVQRDKNVSSGGNANQLYISPTAWANRVEVNGWLFTQLGNAYCAIKPAGGGYASEAAGTGVNLTMGDMWAPVVIQMGQAVDYAGFGDFQSSVQANAFTYAAGTMNYTSEAGDTFTFYANSKTTPRVNGATVNLNPAKTYDSPYLSMIHGEETATVSYAGYEDLLLDFGSPPSLAALTPSDNSTGVSSVANLVAEFNEPVQAGTGFIAIRRAADDSLVEGFDVANPARVSITGSSLTVNPTDPFEAGEAYYVTIDTTAVQDLAGNAFPGFTDNSGWNFSTDGSPPAIESLNPVDDTGGVAVNASLVVTFNETVQAGTGFITIRKSVDNSLFETFDVTFSPGVSFNGSQITINPAGDLASGTAYYVTIDPASVEDLAGNAFSGISGNSGWNFATSDGTSSPIIAVNDGSFGGSAPGATVTQAIAVGAGADMLIVMTSSELGGLSGEPMTVTYGGVAMNLAAGNLVNSGIWYLDLSSPGIAGTNVVVNMSGYGTRNGFAAGWVSIDGNLKAGESIALHGTSTSAAQSDTAILETTTETFNVVNFNGNNRGGTITVNLPAPAVIYTDDDIGSARSAAAYVEGAAAGTGTYQWTLGGVTSPNADYRRIDAAAFVFVPASGGNEFPDWIAGYPEVGGLTGLADDPDGDGIPNAIEAVFGTHPGEFSSGFANLTTDATTTTFTHPQSENPPSDLTLSYKWSTNLVEWYDGDGVDGPVGGERVSISSLAVGTTANVTATASQPMDRLFVRPVAPQDR